MELNLKLNISDEEIKYLIWSQKRPVIPDYNPIINQMVHLGILLTTTLEKDGKYGGKMYVLPSGIGKMILDTL